MDRQLIRMNESLESVKTISECIKRCGRWNRRSRYLQNLLITNMESMIHYFKLVSEGYTFGCSETYLRQEAPKGELGSQVLSGIIKPDRVKIRSPDYYNLQALNIISSCHYLADLIAVLGSADFVLGSVDRIIAKKIKAEIIARLPYRQLRIMVRNKINRLNYYWLAGAALLMRYPANRI